MNSKTKFDNLLGEYKGLAAAIKRSVDSRDITIAMRMATSIDVGVLDHHSADAIFNRCFDLETQLLSGFDRPFYFENGVRTLHFVERTIYTFVYDDGWVQVCDTEGMAGYSVHEFLYHGRRLRHLIIAFSRTLGIALPDKRGYSFDPRRHRIWVTICTVPQATTVQRMLREAEVQKVLAKKTDPGVHLRYSLGQALMAA